MPHFLTLGQAKITAQETFPFPFLAKSQLPFPLVNVNVNSAALARQRNRNLLFLSFCGRRRTGRTMQRSMPVVVRN